VIGKKYLALNYLYVLIFLFAAGTPAESFAEALPKISPLFPVGLEHEFVEPAKTFEEVKQLILDQYYSEEITEQALYWAAIQGMLRHISPPELPDLAKIWTKDQYEEILNSIKGEHVSIGIKSTFNPKEGSLTVTEVLPDSPAESILKPYDRILRIDSKPLIGKSLAQISEMLNGKVKTSVELTVNRDIKVFDVTLTYERFPVKNLIVTRINDETALVEIKNFVENIAAEVKAALDALEKDNTKALIIDLRNNPGGLLIEALRMTELFLPEKDIILRTLKRETNLQNYISTNKAPYPFKIAVLVNHKTASSAEVLAGSLQDHNKALIVGTRTFGKGVFENTFTLKNQHRVKFITGAMYSPKGRTWQSRGITPDFLVEQDEKTLSALMHIEPVQRFVKDVAMITAYKLLQMKD
jgi:carboxyl-terminal processing protease